jgi:type II secretory pathway component PulF
MIYSYEAKDGDGRTITGSVDAADERSAARQVRELGYFLMRLVPATVSRAAVAAPRRAGVETPWPTTVSAPEPQVYVESEDAPPGTKRWVVALRSIWTGVGIRDLALFYRQFATMIHAGVPLYQCLTTLNAQTSNPVLRRTIEQIGRRVQAGDSLGVAMAATPWLFTDFHRAMVAAGEMTGRLDLMFARMADALEQEYALRNNIKRETWYPALVFIMSFLLNPVAIVDLVVHGSVIGYFRLAAPPLLECLVVVAAVYIFTRIGAQFKRAYDAVLSNTPAIGGAVRMIALARFARALALLYAAGVGIPSAVKTAAAAGGNAYLAAKMVRAIPALQAGHGITEALSATGAFPPMVVTMLGVGEQTGDMDQTMNKVADFFEQEAAVRLHQLSVTLGAVVTILVGIKIGLFVIHFYTGYFNNLLNM